MLCLIRSCSDVRGRKTDVSAARFEGECGRVILTSQSHSYRRGSDGCRGEIRKQKGVRNICKFQLRASRQSDKTKSIRFVLSTVTSTNSTQSLLYCIHKIEIIRQYESFISYSCKATTFNSTPLQPTISSSQLVYSYTLVPTLSPQPSSLARPSQQQ